MLPALHQGAMHSLGLEWAHAHGLGVAAHMLLTMAYGSTAALLLSRALAGLPRQAPWRAGLPSHTRWRVQTTSGRRVHVPKCDARCRCPRALTAQWYNTLIRELYRNRFVATHVVLLSTRCRCRSQPCVAAPSCLHHDFHWKTETNGIRLRARCTAAQLPRYATTRSAHMPGTPLFTGS
jgi:hypothetical protein